MRFQGVLFASDFDGTLAPSDKRLRPAVLRAIHFFIQNGGYFTLGDKIGTFGYSVRKKRRKKR